VGFHVKLRELCGGWAEQSGDSVAVIVQHIAVQTAAGAFPVRIFQKFQGRVPLPGAQRYYIGTGQLASIAEGLSSDIEAV
jgi:hypothetical protein|tara:strand:- start:290 stop:529 length:240 start_codon:yes stop_codon:yes gene_type:complete